MNEAAPRAITDPGGFHGDVAARELHWFDPGGERWLTFEPESERWSGWSAVDGRAVEAADLDKEWRPWRQAFDDSAAPFFRWFAGGLTNACFNEVDRHVLAGHGERIAFVFEGDRWDPSKNGGRGGPVYEEAISYRRLLYETVRSAEVLRGLGLAAGDRVAFNLPNIPQQLFYTEAAKRLGVVYTPVFGGFSAKTLSERITDTGARVVVTADGGYRNAEIVPFKETFTDRALDHYLPLSAALSSLESALGTSELSEAAARLLTAVCTALEGEITVERSEVMRELGRALELEHGLAPAVRARARTAAARSLAEATPFVEHVVVVRHTGQEIVEQPRDSWSSDLGVDATWRILAKARAAGFKVRHEPDLFELPDRDFWRALAASCPARPVDAEWPLFVIYTSGSTGKPKGVVHVHGGWLCGLVHSLRAVFGVAAGDRIYVVADPGWITGQSYLISAPLACGITSIVAEGSPLFPHAGRFASIIERHGVTLFKAGSTFLKSVMTDPDSVQDMAAYDLRSLKAATFCAEPVSPAVQRFAMDSLCPRYINSYWATEHGGMIFSRPWSTDEPLAADAKTWALEWIDAEVRTALARDAAGRAVRWRRAADGEKGELVITRPYPYLARTLWGDAEHLGEPGWRGDLERFTEVYLSRWSGAWAYTQGDYARRHADGSFTLHGRSDDVINVSGHRIGTEEIEGAILRDKLQRTDSPVGNAVVVGAPHEEKGQTPVAFLIPAPGRKIGDDDLGRLSDLVRAEKGSAAAPSDYLVVSQFPETRSGKYMRRMARAILLGEPVGDVSTLRNPEAVAEIRRRVAEWRERGRLTDERRMLEVYRYLRVENHALTAGGSVAIVRFDHPPVNALSKRCLDELNTVLGHLERREETVGVVITGTGNTFIAGADVKELLEVGEAGDHDGALALAHAAHQAFAALEKLGKPVVAAVNGPALGGGNELVLAATYVVAEGEARFGQPEINLNLLPGYGGTQRLPRKLLTRRGGQGLAAALNLVLSGRTLSAEEARKVCLVDLVVGLAGDCRDALSTAVELVRRHAAGGGLLVEALERQQSEIASRTTTFEIPKTIARDESVAEVLSQALRGGRGAAVERILEALRTGLEQGFSTGARREAELFAEALCEPQSGPAGIRRFLDKSSAPLPTRHAAVAPLADETRRRTLEAEGRLLPLAASFFPGVTRIPGFQYALAVVKNGDAGAAGDGSPEHGDPIDAERLVVMPTPRPGPNEALVYVLASEVNFNDIWALTGIPVSPFDARDVDVHVTGSGGVGLIAALGSELKREGRLAVGDLVTIYSGQSELLSPDQGLDPMAADFRIQGYERADGSHAQFVVVQGPQLHAKLPGLPLEVAGSYGLNLGTIQRALSTTLAVRPGQRLFVEGAATGTGLECLKTALGSGLRVAGMVSSEERAAVVRDHGGAPVDRKAARWTGIFTPVPGDPAAVADWVEAGRPFVETVTASVGGPIDAVVSHAGERAFPRSFQLLGKGGVLAFYGASSGYRFTFVGKAGAASPEAMLRRAGVRPGTSLLVMYGPGATDGIVDPPGIEALEAGRTLGARLVVLADTAAQRDFVTSLSFGATLAGVVAVEEIARRLGSAFDAPQPLGQLPDPLCRPDAFRRAVRRWNERALKPLGAAIGAHLRTRAERRGLPDVIFERAGRDSLTLSTTLVKPMVGRVVFAEDLGGRRFTFYAPQVWMRQRRILMPTAEIRGTHLNTAREFAEMQEAIAAGRLDVTEPVPVPFEELPRAHQQMWENRHAGATYVALHAIPRPGLKTRDELYRAWAVRDAETRGEAPRRIDTGSAGALR